MRPDALKLLAPPPPPFGQNLCESAQSADHPAVELHSDVWGTPPTSDFRPPTSDLRNEQLPPSTFAPPPVDTPAADYNTLYGHIIAELDRLEELLVTIRMRDRLSRIVPMFVLCVLLAASASAQTVEVRPPSRTPTSFDIAGSHSSVAVSSAEAEKLRINVDTVSFGVLPNWSLTSLELLPGRSKPHNDPHELELLFTGYDGSRWRAVKWERVK